MNLTDTIGAVAAFISVVSLVPQVFKTWRTKHAEDLSYGWLLMALVGTALWAAYGSMKADWVISATNLILAGMVAALLAMKRAYARGK